MKTVPPKQALAKAERIIHDMEGALWQLYRIFGQDGYEDVVKQMDQIDSLLFDIRRGTLESLADIRCRYCSRPVFTPVYVDYEDEGLQPLHKRCAYQREQWKLKRQRDRGKQ